MKTPLSTRLMTHADSMQGEGWYTTANVLAEAAEVVEITESDMTTAQYLAALKKLGLTPSGQQTAEALGLSLRQCQRIASGDSGVPGPVGRLLRFMLKHGTEP